MNKPTEQTCGNCTHWNPIGRNRGQCRINPPVIVPTLIGQTDMESPEDISNWVWAATRYPISMSHEWCSQQYRKDA